MIVPVLLLRAETDVIDIDVFVVVNCTDLDRTSLVRRFLFAAAAAVIIFSVVIVIGDRAFVGGVGGGAVLAIAAVAVDIVCLLGVVFGSNNEEE